MIRRIREAAQPRLSAVSAQESHREVVEYPMEATCLRFSVVLGARQHPQGSRACHSSILHMVHCWAHPINGCQDDGLIYSFSWTVYPPFSDEMLWIFFVLWIHLFLRRNSFKQKRKQNR